MVNQKKNKLRTLWKKIELALNEYSLYDEFLGVGKVIPTSSLMGVKPGDAQIDDMVSSLEGISADNKKDLAICYKLAIDFYHLAWRLPLTGSNWEQVVENILSECNFEVITNASKSHARGRDLESTFFNWISCKGARIQYKSRSKRHQVDISSYRLTGVSITKENRIEMIRSFNYSFQYYFMSLYEIKNIVGGLKYIYSFYIIPRDSFLNMDNFFFEGHSDKSNIVDDIRLEIKEGCSQQLWISVLDLNTLEKFRITTTEVDVLSEKKINLFTYDK